MKNKIIGACLIGVGLLLSVFFWAPLAPNGETIFGASRFSPGGGSERSPGLWQLIGTVISPTNSSYSLSVPVSTASSTFTTALNVPYITDKQVYFSDRGTAKGSAGLTYASSTYALEVGDGNTGYVSSTRLIVGPGTVGTGGIQFTGNGSGVTGIASETTNALVVRINGTNAWRFNANRHIEPVANNSYDIGTGSLGIRTLYFATSIRGPSVSSTGIIASAAGIDPNTNMSASTPGRFQTNSNSIVPLQVGNSGASGFTGMEFFPGTSAVQGFMGYDNANNSFRYNNINAAGYHTFLTNAIERLRVGNAAVTATVPVVPSTARTLTLGSPAFPWGPVYASGTSFIDGLAVSSTVTADGTTGAQTINKTSGTVNFAAAATSLVVTNNLVTANSRIFCSVGTNDTSMTGCTVVAGAGSFTIRPNAPPAAETRVNFIVFN